MGAKSRLRASLRACDGSIVTAVARSSFDPLTGCHFSPVPVAQERSQQLPAGGIRRARRASRSAETSEARREKNMFEGRSQGPKTSRWTKESRMGFEAFFARRSEPLAWA